MKATFMCPDWCVGIQSVSSRCGLGEHRSEVVEFAVPRAGVFRAHRVQVTWPGSLQIAASVPLPPASEAEQREFIRRLLSEVHVAISGVERVSGRRQLSSVR